MRLVEHFGSLSHAEGGNEATVRVVAVGALHETLVDAVFGRQVELRPHIRVALVAGLGLALRQQILIGDRMVIGVARGARDIVFGMLRPADIGVIEEGVLKTV
jgi:hypothetical protein